MCILACNTGFALALLQTQQTIVMDGGRIVATGTHDELARGGGLYAKLAKMQFWDAPVSAVPAVEASA